MQNPALTNPTLCSKASDGVFCKPLQALVLAIVVFFLVQLLQLYFELASMLMD